MYTHTHTQRQRKSMHVLSHFSSVWLFVTPWTVTPLTVSVQARLLAVGCHFFLQGIFLTQGWNPCLLHLLHCRWILYPLNHLGSPKRKRGWNKGKETEITDLCKGSAQEWTRWKITSTEEPSSPSYPLQLTADSDLLRLLLHTQMLLHCFTYTIKAVTGLQGGVSPIIKDDSKAGR